ncbi:MAG: MATE family efflux transporter [Oscillospiraceae bacterium]|nr:MATE family efflux transporter [Oscillospiraceae bacterium]
MPGVASQIAAGRWDSAKKRIEFSILVTILIGLPITVIMAVFSQEILLILFPNAPSRK